MKGHGLYVSATDKVHESANPSELIPLADHGNIKLIAGASTTEDGILEASAIRF